MKKIKLTQGKEAIVDDSYYDALVAMGSWCYDIRRKSARLSQTGQCMQTIVCILASKPPTAEILHCDGNKLNNQLSNLPTTIEERFWSRVDKRTIDECWNWKENTDKDGYGRIYLYGKTYKAHRLAYAYIKGNPGNLCVLHSCDNPSCCNPNHLWLGTDKDNNKDRHEKERDARGEIHGRSKLTEENVKEIRNLKETCEALARKFGVHFAQIARARRKATWKHV
jgi:hypothetical protein